ncbi:hypothetical protein [Poseidonocella sp. HB161398]|uniref:hypothetical protein n=1 Tax=Poseidonocella sp. HB161398 TaxID=2320855 RepID=UPI00148646CF|nr:hypothetical protein [Poseidonocella sp. HB161398]
MATASYTTPRDMIPFEARIRELAAGKPLLEVATDVVLKARAELRRDLAILERPLRDHGKSDPA